MEEFQVNIIQLSDGNQPERWQLYNRLRELDIECYCGSAQPLQMQLAGAFSAVQAWSVMRQMYGSKDCLRAWLEQCWRLERMPASCCEAS